VTKEGEGGNTPESNYQRDKRRPVAKTFGHQRLDGKYCKNCIAECEAHAAEMFSSKWRNPLKSYFKLYLPLLQLATDISIIQKFRK
jgi:hypothetical protein